MESLFRYERKQSERGRCLVATSAIGEGRLIFAERPLVALQSTGNVHEGVIVCSYCMAFCGTPQQALKVASDPSRLVGITTTPLPPPPAGRDEDDDDDDEYAMVQCRQHCGHVYCCRECQQDDWEWGGHQELCTGAIVMGPGEQEQEGDEAVDSCCAPVVACQSSSCESNRRSASPSPSPPSIPDLLQFKIHARETNEIFLVIASWLIRILKHDLPLPDGGNGGHDRQPHPYTDFQMDAWWDVKTNELLNQGELSDPGAFAEAMELEATLKGLCKDSHRYLRGALSSTNAYRQAWHSEEWVTPVMMARLIGSMEQNCLGIRRKHALRKSVMENTELRRQLHSELIKCLERAGLIGEEASSGDDEEGEADDGDGDENGKADDVADERQGATASEGDECMTSKNKADEEDDGSHDGADQDALLEPGEEWDYSYDEIADFLASFPTPLKIGADDAWDDIFRPLDGTAHFSISSKMNHSCEPNVVLLYKTRGWGKDHPLVAYCVALKDIAVGEELTISYIISDDSYEERQMALANYGFVCTCPKCQKEKDVKDKNGDHGNESDGYVEDDVSEHNDHDDDNVADNVQDAGTALEGNYSHSSGEDKLLHVAEQLETFLNNSTNAAIPIVYLAPVLEYVENLVPDLLENLIGSVEESERCLVIRDLLNQCVDALKDNDFSSCRIVGSDLELYLYSHQKNQCSWKNPSYRSSYWIASVVASVGFAHECSFLVSMKFLDKALIFGLDRKAIEGFFSYVEFFASQMAAAPCPLAIDCVIADFSDPQLRVDMTSTALSNPIVFPIDEVSYDEPSKVTRMFAPHEEATPVVIRGMAITWPAVDKWRHLDHLAKEFGHRLVPIEGGSIKNGMQKGITSFRKFVSRHMSPSAAKNCWSLEDATSDGKVKITNLAQHPLLDQIPSLSSHVDTNPCGMQPTKIDVWMGTGGARTRLHFDSYDNLLVQIVGATYIRLYPQSDASKLYISKGESYGHGLPGNVSEVDCEMEDYERHPLAKDCAYTEVVLFPGDCLFIPSRHWHYSRPLSTSVRIGYWFQDS